MRRPAVKGVRVLSPWQVDPLAGEASWVQMCGACWEGTCATWTCDDGPWPLSTEPTAPTPRHGSIPPCSLLSPFSPSSSELPVLQRVGQPGTVDVVGENEMGKGAMGWRRPVVGRG